MARLGLGLGLGIELGLGAKVRDMARLGLGESLTPLTRDKRD